MRNPFRVALPAIVLFSVPAFAGSAPAGLSNFYKVDDHVYRGAQPDEEGFKSLAQLGIRTVIDLRGSEHSEADEKRMVEANGMRYVGIPMKGMHRPTEEQISAALKLLNDPKSGPVFVHCKRGADRTGAVVACYRIGHDKWDNTKAQSEANSFGMSWYQLQLRRYVEHYGAAPASTSPATGIAAAVVAPAH